MGNRVGYNDSEENRSHAKYAYIDGVKSGIENIESFMGSRVHDALKEFYDLAKNKVIKPKEWLTEDQGDRDEHDIAAARMDGSVE